MNARQPVIAGFGEVMLRLAPRGKQRLSQVLPGQLEATFGGAEANVCAELAGWRIATRYLTVLPDNPVAYAFETEMRGLGCDVGRIRHSADGRIGLYYIEQGANQRPSQVYYDRAHSAIAAIEVTQEEAQTMLDGCTHLHISGITPGLSETAFRSTLRLAELARRNGMTVSCDLNFRRKLWRWRSGATPEQLAQECMTALVNQTDWLIANEEDAKDVFGITAPGAKIEAGELNPEGYKEVARRLAQRFPALRRIAITLRESRSAEINRWGGMLFDTETEETVFAPLDGDGNYAPYEIQDIVDRFGAGDSFCGGLLYAFYSETWRQPADAIRFAVAASCLKHSIYGDYNRVSVQDVELLAAGNACGRVRR